MHFENFSYKIDSAYMSNTYLTPYWPCVSIQKDYYLNLLKFLQYAFKKLYIKLPFSMEPQLKLIRKLFE